MLNGFAIFAIDPWPSAVATTTKTEFEYFNGIFNLSPGSYTIFSRSAAGDLAQGMYRFIAVGK